MSGQVDCSQIYRSFDVRMQTLYALNTTIQETIGEAEWGMLREFAQEVFSLFGEEYDPTELQSLWQSLMERLLKVDDEQDILDVKKIWETMEIDEDSPIELVDGGVQITPEHVAALKEWAQENPAKANRLFRAFIRIKFRAPVKSEVSRQGILLAAVSQFEFLLLHLLHVCHDLEPGQQPVKEWTTEIAEKYCLKKIGSTKRRYASSMEKLHVVAKGFSNSEFVEGTFQEIFERRNVFAHRIGRADETYVTQNPQAQIGIPLIISRRYLQQAIEYLHLWGLILCQRLWRRLGADSVADRTLSDTAMQLIKDGRYTFCASAVERFQEIIQTNVPSTRDILWINLALCMDKLGNHKSRDKVLKRVRVTPRSSTPSISGVKRLKISEEPILPRIPLSVSILHGQRQDALRLLGEAIEAGDVKYLDLVSWPIFDYLADEPEFRDWLQRLEAQIEIV